MRFSLILIFVVISWCSSSTPVAADAATDRQKIGLALSGGGARGGAHIGVLKALEELQIPIDYIAGTSMGAIVGGLYSAGHSVEEIETILKETNWTDAFSDGPKRKDMTMRKKELEGNYLIPLRLGFNDGEIQLPLGVIEGQKIDQILKRALLRDKDTHDFDDLHIPFRAIATDLVTGKEVVLGSGSLTNAIRASMSVPSLIAPVRLNNQMLVDGGMANNLPISVVREMGADIVIAVDISSPLLTREEIDSVFTVTEQLTNFLTRRNTDAQIATLEPQDYLFVPELGDFSSSAFDKALEIVPKGYDVVMASRSDLEHLAGLEGLTRPRRPEFVMDDADDYIVHFININNQSVLNDEIIRSRLGVQPGEKLDFNELEDSINHIYSIDVFQTVTYTLIKNQAGETGLQVNAIPRQWGPNYLQFGMEFTDDFSGNADFGFSAAYTRNALNSYGGELRFDFAVGREDLLDVDFYQPIDKKARWYVEPRAFWSRRQFNIFNEDQFQSLLEVAGVGGSFAIGRNFDSTSLLRLGYEYFTGKTNEVIGDGSSFVDDSVQYGEFSLMYRHDSQDNLWFPTNGNLFVVGLRAGRDAMGAELDYEQLLANSSFAYTMGKNSGVLNLQAAYSFDDAAPLERWFELGGFGRLSGLIPDQLVGRHFGLATLALYRSLNEVQSLPIYAGFTLEAGNTWTNESDINFDSLNYAASIFLGADTPLGPIYLAYGYADNGDNTFYFFLGNPWKHSRF